MNSLTDYTPWTATKAAITLDCGCKVLIPVLAGADGQAVLDTITITAYFVHLKLPCKGGRME